MIRELVRRACGHLQTVSIFATRGGWTDREIRKKELELCSICRERQKYSNMTEKEEEGSTNEKQPSKTNNTEETK